VIKMTEDKKHPVEEFYRKRYLLGYHKKLPPGFMEWNHREEEYLLNTLEKNSSILEVGCGEGRLLTVLADKSSNLIGIDLSYIAIKKAQDAHRYLANVQFYIMNATDLKFVDSCFDYTLCMMNTFGNFYYNKQRILSEMLRVTRPGGRLIISVHSEKALDDQIILYHRLGYKIEKIDEDYVYCDSGLISERFSEKKLREILDARNLEYKLELLCQDAYLVDIMVKNDQRTST